MNRDVCEHFNPVNLPCAKCDAKRKSEALFLADELEIPLGTVIQSEVNRRAAAELRRLHAQRDALLEALEDMLGWQSLAPQMIQESAKGRAYALRASLAEPVQEGCEHCNQPLYAAIKCRVCGRETRIIEPEIKGDNKPVAWLWPHQLAELQEWKNEGNIRAWSGRHYKPDGVVPVYTKPQGGSDA